MEKTIYAGVYSRTSKNKPNESTFYIIYRRGGREAKQIKEPVGKSIHGMTAAKANQIRIMRLRGIEQSNTDRRQEIKAQKDALDKIYTLSRVWNIYLEENAHKAIIKPDKIYIKHLDSLIQKEVGEISKHDITSLTTYLKTHISVHTKKNLSPQTQKHVLALLRRLFSFARDKDLCEVPSFKIIMPTVNNQKTEFMSQAQNEKYLEALDKDKNVNAANVLKFIYHTGIRKNAALSLKWDDVNLELGCLTLQADYAKNKKTEILPLSDIALNLLKSVQRTDSPYDFPNEKGEKRGDIRKFAEKMKKQAGLDADFRPIHGLRHNFASSLVNNGADLYSVQKLLTHSSPEMTQRYAHLQMDTLKKLLNKNDKDKE